MDSEEYNVFVDEVSETVNSICKDASMMDRIMYIVVEKIMDRFEISAEEALEFWTSTAQEALEFALNGESEE